MKKILKHGQRTIEYNIFKITCPICGCEFECNQDDVRPFRGEFDRCPDFIVGYVDCPDCGKKITVRKNDMIGHTYETITYGDRDEESVEVTEESESDD